jgi:hypothetical protein
MLKKVTRYEIAGSVCPHISQNTKQISKKFGGFSILKVAGLWVYFYTQTTDRRFSQYYKHYVTPREAIAQKLKICENKIWEDIWA